MTCGRGAHDKCSLVLHLVACLYFVFVCMPLLPAVHRCCLSCASVYSGATRRKRRTVSRTRSQEFIHHWAHVTVSVYGVPSIVNNVLFVLMHTDGVVTRSKNKIRLRTKSVSQLSKAVIDSRRVPKLRRFPTFFFSFFSILHWHPDQVSVVGTSCKFRELLVATEGLFNRSPPSPGPRYLYGRALSVMAVIRLQRGRTINHRGPHPHLFIYFSSTSDFFVTSSLQRSRAGCLRRGSGHELGPTRGGRLEVEAEGSADGPHAVRGGGGFRREGDNPVTFFNRSHFGLTIWLLFV